MYFISESVQTDLWVLWYEHMGRRNENTPGKQDLKAERKIISCCKEDFIIISKLKSRRYRFVDLWRLVNNFYLPGIWEIVYG